MEKQNFRIRADELKARGFANTYELIQACRSSDKRRELSALLGVSEARIERWLALVYPNNESTVVKDVVGLLENGGITVLKPDTTRPDPE